jgi:hypothetical protein
MAVKNPLGDYTFLEARGQPFSNGAAADPGFDMVHATLERPLPLELGLQAATRHLAKAGRPAQAIAGFELRIPEPLSAHGFDEFNRGYVERLESIGLAVDGLLPAARTNVAPTPSAVAQPSLYAFTYTVPGDRGRPAFVMSGVPEASSGDPESMLDSIVSVLSARMTSLGVSWSDVTAMQLYGIDQVQGLLVEKVLPRLGPAAVHGVHWFPSLPPIEALRFEIDVRSAGVELVLSV